MKYIVREVGINGKALVYRETNELICYRKGNLYFYNLENGTNNKTVRLPLKGWKRVLCHLRILERLLHIDARWAVQMNKEHLLVQFNHGIYLVNTESLAVAEEIVPVKGNPLSVAEIKDIPGFDDQYVVGDYTRNKNRGSVNLYSRNRGGKWRIVWQFSPGTVRHIHGCVSDKENKCVYILTGDEDKESGIWKATNNFNEVQPLLTGSQQYRACQMYLNGKDLYYFTDAPSQFNYMYRYKNGSIERLNRLSGTCIYGTNSGGYGYYSTTCEPEAYSKNKADYWLTNKSGSGIEDNKIDVLAVDQNGVLSKLISYEHDGLPLRLFQYGTVTFSNIIDNRAYFTPLCVKKHDMKVFEVTANEIGRKDKEQRI